MKARAWKSVLAGATAAGLVIPGIALADPFCVYVMGTVDSVTVATPAVIVYVPPTEAEVQPVRVHLDEEEQSILGYSVRTPGVDEGTSPEKVFVPALESTINPIVATTPELPIEAQRCININESVPAIPIYVPSTVLQTPGASVDTPSITLSILGQSVTTPGKVFLLEGKTVVIPAINATTPVIPVSTPEQTVVVNVNGSVESARYLQPPEAQ